VLAVVNVTNSLHTMCNVLQCSELLYSEMSCLLSVDLADGAELEYCALAFSTSEYLVSISGVPEYRLIIWYVVQLVAADNIY